MKSILSIGLLTLLVLSSSSCTTHVHADGRTGYQGKSRSHSSHHQSRSRSGVNANVNLGL